MLYWLLFEVLAKAEGVSFLRVFGYTSTRVIAAAITALGISFLLGPWFIERLKQAQIGQQIREDGPQTHKKKAGTPTMGGSLVLLALVVPTILWCDPANELVWLTLFITVGYGALGWTDDYLKVSKKNTKGVAGRVKLFWQFTLAGVALVYLFYFSPAYAQVAKTQLMLPFLDFQHGFKLILPQWFYVCFAITVVVAASNTVNLTDGLDGLAIGPVIMNAGTFLLFAWVAGSAALLAVPGGPTSLAEYLRVAHVPGSAELAIYCAAMMGAGIGFLWYNTYPAQVFMGDVGSLSLGGGIGMLAVMTKHELTLAIVGGLFVLEGLSVIIQVGSFKLRGKRVFKMAPIHHHYELKGWAEPKIIVRFWIISILLALIALGTLKVR
jgi:phospho-N-acetylmuramoyl-pentapeptide-transferase